MYRLTPKEEISARIGALRVKLTQAGLDGAVIVQNPDLFYFAGSIQQGILVIPAAKEPVYFVRKVYERAVAESPVEIIVKISGLKDIPAWLGKKGISFRSLGFEMDVMPVLTFNRYAALFPGVRTEDISGAVREIRAVKGRSGVQGPVDRARHRHRGGRVPLQREGIEDRPGARDDVRHGAQVRLPRRGGGGAGKRLSRHRNRVRETDSDGGRGPCLRRRGLVEWGERRGRVPA